MPVELAFTTSEASLRDFLKAMVNSEKYFFSIRAVRLRNERQTPPSVKDADFPDGGGGGGVGAATPAGADPFGDFVIPGDDAPEGDGGDDVEAPAAAPVADGGRILKQVLGSEKLHVYISFDILLIKGKKSDAPASPEPSDG